MTDTHTPGPWGIITVETSCGICHKIGPFPYKRDQKIHACVYVDYPGNGEIEAELLANAHLMAAAPEMATERDNLKEINADLLEALELIGHIKDNPNGLDDPLSFRIAEWWPKLCDAIAKARGDS